MTEPANQNTRVWRRALGSALVIVASVATWGVICLPAVALWRAFGPLP